MLAGRGDPLWSTALMPETAPDPHAPLPAWEDAIQQALAARPELAQNAIAGGVNLLDEKLAREAEKPRIDAFANLSTQGLAGAGNTSLSASPLAVFFPGGFGAVPALMGGYGQSMSNLASGKFPSVQVGVQVSLPVRNRTATAQAATAAAEARRLKTLRNQLRFDAAVLARRSAEEQYASEQRQFQAGTTTVFLVLQRQTDLIAARAREVRARADCAESVANLDRATARTLDARGIALKP